LRFDEKCSHWRKLHKEGGVAFRKRFIFIVLIGASFHFLVYKLILTNTSFQLSSLIFTLVTFFLFSETILLLDRIIAKYFPWHESIKKRVLSLFAFSIVFFYITSKYIPLIEPIFVKKVIEDTEKYKLITMIGFLYLVIYVVLIIARNFHQSLNYFVYENEKLKQDKILSDYKALQDQLNPHFLFNNLSTLIAIIHSDKNKAVSFAENFTDVYRYVLSKEGQVAISVDDELNFLESYTNLHLARIGEGLIVKVNVDHDTRKKRVPHLSLQVLVENAIKHNITSKSKPLAITIGVEKDRLFVENNKQLKEATYSTKTGLSNLGKRLKILTDEEYQIKESDDFYRVEIPLID